MKFVVVTLVSNHENHVVGADVFALYPESRRPTGNAAVEMDAMLSAGGNSSLVAASMQRKGISVKVKDVLNRRRLLHAAGKNFHTK